MNKTSDRFSAELEATLRSSGWYPGRRVEEDKVTTWCREIIAHSGCRIFPAAVNVLREFGGLEIDRPRPKLSEDDEDYEWPPSVKFWPSSYENESGASRGWFGREWILDEVIFPVAVYSIAEIYLAISPGGRVYGFGYGFWLCGETMDEALEKWSGNVPTWEKVVVPDLEERQLEARHFYNNLIDTS